MANPLNNSFETWTVAGVPGTSNGTCTNWTAYSENGGTFTRESSTAKDGSYSANIRSNNAGNINSIGGCISDAFYLDKANITFWTRQPETTTQVEIYFYLLDASNNVLYSEEITPASPTGTWVEKSIDISAYANQNVKIKFTQHTKLEGAGYATFIDLVEISGDLPSVQKTITSDAKIKVLDNQQIIESDALITTSVQKTILSDAKIKAVDLQETILSDAEIIPKPPIQQTIDSDAKIKVLNNQQTIDSDARILVHYSEKINTDFRTRIEAEKIANLFLATQFGSKINCDFRTKKETDNQVNTDLRFTLYDPSLVSLYPLARTDFHVHIDDVELTDNDLKLDSIKIVHTADNKSNAEFVLLRKHDNLDTPTTITANNVVKIYLKTKLEFTGRIVTLDTNSEEESVNVKCETDDITEDYNIVTKELPLTVLNTQIHLYDILINDVAIDNPYMSSYLVIVGSNNRYWDGTKWVRKVYDALTFETFAAATAYIAANQSNSGFTKNSPIVTNYEENPKYYRGIKVDLGKEIKQNIMIWYTTHSTQATAEKVEDGTFKFVPNCTYFWRASVQWFDWDGGYRPSGWQYIGTSLGPLSTDLYEITGADYCYQRIFDDTETELGYYTLGIAPFKDVSIKNGIKKTYPKWVDREDGLYYEKDYGYNYENYDKQVAALEYDKLKNINGDILPITNANLDLTIDGYLYYGLKLLTRININNTTTANIYKDSNGFPVSIKQITIDSSTMKTNLNCDNQKSAYELELIDGQYPEEPEEFGGFSQKYYTKFDLSRWEDIDD